MMNASSRPTSSCRRAGNASRTRRSAVGLPYEPLIREAEAIFLVHGGRPHWGKPHWLEREVVARLYPELERFRGIGAELDPKGVFTNGYLARLGVGADRTSPTR